MDPKTPAVTTNDVVQWPHEIPERLEFVLDNHRYDYLIDIRFEVGSTKEVIGAHEAILLVSDDCFVELFQKLPGEVKVRCLQFPELDAAGFRLMLKYAYTNQLQTGNQDVLDPILFEALRCAKAIGYKAFEEKCVDFITSKLSNQNCIQLYAKAKTVQLDDPELTQLLMGHIKENVKNVLEASEFTEVSEEELCLFLSCDDWFLDELSVFEAVKRWALARMDVAASEEKGRALRTAMGKAFDLIRFPLLTFRQFNRVWAAHEGFFEDSEIVNLLGYINGHAGGRQPEPFVTRHRGIGLVRFAEGRQCPEIDIADDAKELEVAIKSEIEPESVGAETCEQDPPGPSSRPEPPSGSLENEEVEESPSKRTKLELMSLSMYVDELQENREFTSGIREIDEKLKLILPTGSVYMPNLTTFHLKLVPCKDFLHGAALKNFLRTRLSSLDRIFFFYLRREAVMSVPARGSFLMSSVLSPFEKLIGNLLCQGVSVSISVSGATILKICPATGTLTMHCLSTKDAQMILDTCGSSSSRNFVLTKLVISECKLTSLRKVNVDNLETVLFRRVEGIDNFRRFIRHCPKLKQFISNNLNGESIDLYRDLLRDKPDLEKAYLSIFRLFSSYLQTDDDDEDEDEWFSHPNLRELYLHRFELTDDENVLQDFPRMFPSLQRIALNQDNCLNADILYEILQMPSINWIMVHRLRLKIENGKMTPKSEKVRNFLRAIFTREFVYNLGEAMFVLERRQDLDLMAEDGNDAIFGPLRAWQWKGIDLADEGECERYYDTDFGHSSYGEIFQDVETYNWFLTTVKDVTKRKMVARNVKAC